MKGLMCSIYWRMCREQGMTGDPLQAETPTVAAWEAGERRREVYMGIDVFGRGTYGGGQLNSYVAAAAALKEGGSNPAPPEASA